MHHWILFIHLKLLNWLTLFFFLLLSYLNMGFLLSYSSINSVIQSYTIPFEHWQYCIGNKYYKQYVVRCGIFVLLYNKNGWMLLYKMIWSPLVWFKYKAVFVLTVVVSCCQSEQPTVFHCYSHWVRVGRWDSQSLENGNIQQKEVTINQSTINSGVTRLFMWDNRRKTEQTMVPSMKVIAKGMVPNSFIEGEGLMAFVLVSVFHQYSQFVVILQGWMHIHFANPLLW